MKKSILSLFLMLLTTLLIAQNKTLLVGTYTNSCSKNGIYVYDFNQKTGKLKLKNKADSIINPSYLTYDNKQKIVYSVSENSNKSSVSSFKLNETSGKLTFLNSNNSVGADPCFIISDEKNIITANYSGGNISIFEKSSEGKIGDLKQTVQHKGKGFIKGQQDSPHVHQVMFSPNKKMILANDLGTDKIYIYDYSIQEKNPLKIKDSIFVEAGSGPRHLTFSNNGKYLYLLTENTADIFVFEYKNNKFNKIQKISTRKENFTGKSGAADIHISKDGKFLYSSDRIDTNDIAYFSIKNNGELIYKGRSSTFGINPRNFTFDPSGNFILVGNQKTNEIVVFKRNIKTGSMKMVSKQELCSPVCLVFVD